MVSRSFIFSTIPQSVNRLSIGITDKPQCYFAETRHTKKLAENRFTIYGQTIKYAQH